jgi:hypothetical protein
MLTTEPIDPAACLKSHWKKHGRCACESTVLCVRCCLCNIPVAPDMPEINDVLKRKAGRPVNTRVAKRVRPDAYVDPVDDFSDTVVHESEFLCDLVSHLHLTDSAAATAAELSRNCRQLNNIGDSGDRMQKYVQQAARNVIKSVVTGIAPNDPQYVWEVVRRQCDTELQTHPPSQYVAMCQSLMQAARAVLATMPHASPEAKAIHAVFAQCGKKTMDALLSLPDDYNGDDSGGDSDVDEHDDGSGVSEAGDSEVSDIEGTGEGSDCSSADGVAAAGGSGDENASGGSGPCGATAPRKIILLSALQSRLRSRYGSRNQHRRGRNSYRLLMCSTSLQKRVAFRAKRSPAAVASVYAFVSRTDNSTILPWGKATVCVDGVTEFVANRTRRDRIAVLYRRYDREQQQAGTAGRDRVKRSMFYLICGTVTSADLQVKVWIVAWGLFHFAVSNDVKHACH